MRQIDTRGLSCPQPVIMVNKEIITGSDDFEVLLDSMVSCENVMRILQKNKLKVEISAREGHTVYHVKR